MEAAEENLIDRLIVEQQALTAVERFAQKHASCDAPLLEKYYRDLIPLTGPSPGRQFAFEVNLDRCTGCKACVSACHSLNGLGEHETWRDVGVLLGYVKGAAYQQTVTTACHHCLEPGCLEGCPVLAYEKDAFTGIVRHLDDQCIGCQYCTMKCPYDVPKYSKRLGIVRKCDMCHDRLAVGEAPACVQACPHEAITIRSVEVEEVFREAKPGAKMLPGTFDASYTKPTTRYVSGRVIPSDAESASADLLRKEPAHWPLIVMLLLTQWAAGLYVMLGAAAAFGGPAFSRLAFPVSAAALVLLNAGLGAAVFHLGRPLGAWRFFLGLRTSWMSREILVFGLFTGAAFFTTAAAWFSPGWIPPAAMTAVLGLLAVFASGMIYVDTRRAYWNAAAVMVRFYGTLLCLGAALAAALAAWLQVEDLLPFLLGAAILVHCLTFFFEMSRHSDALQDSESANHLSARVVDELLPRLIPARAVLFLLSLGFLLGGWQTAAWLWPALAALLVGGVLERYTFFSAVVAPRMPGIVSG